MIQVLERADVIIGHVTKKREASIAELQSVTGLKYITLYKIVSTLVALGWLERHEKSFVIGRRLSLSGREDHKKNTLAAMGEGYVRPLAEKLREGISLAHLFGGEVFTAILITVERELMVNTGSFDTNSIYGTASGRLLLAYASDEARAEIIGQHGTWKAQWPEIRTTADMTAALNAIRTDGIAFRGTGETEIRAIAVPVFGPDGMWAALGSFVPSVRFKGEHKKIILAELKKSARAMSIALGGQDD
ncbi:MAG: hypothetical protein HZC28_06555 [Spirochaetes bacterium]|nr:hypothetical protein [Spirochaetota bacterium]